MVRVGDKFLSKRSGEGRSGRRFAMLDRAADERDEMESNADGIGAIAIPSELSLDAHDVLRCDAPLLMLFAPVSMIRYVLSGLKPGLFIEVRA